MGLVITAWGKRVYLWVQMAGSEAGGLGHLLILVIRNMYPIFWPYGCAFAFVHT